MFKFYKRPEQELYGAAYPNCQRRRWPIHTSAIDCRSLITCCSKSFDFWRCFMRRTDFLKVNVLSFVLAMSFPSLGKTQATEKTLRAGASAININPDTYPQTLQTMYDPLSSDERDELHSRCIVLD